MVVKKIHIGSDHGGLELKEFLKTFLKVKDIEVDDLGTYTDESVDYPQFGRKVGKAVLADGNPGVIICGTGIGISIAANRIKGVRAALCHCPEYAKLAREHNNANVLALGGRFIQKDDAIKTLTTFISTEYEGGRHDRRVNDIDNY